MPVLSLKIIVRETPADPIAMTPEEETVLRARLEEYLLEHRALDAAIDRLGQDPSMDELQLRRLKKRKLTLKDFIARLKSRLIPDLEA